MTFKGLLAGFVAGLIVATFAPRLADMARQGFDASREIAGTVIEKAGEEVQP